MSNHSDEAISSANNVRVSPEVDSDLDSELQLVGKDDAEDETIRLERKRGVSPTDEGECPEKLLISGPKRTKLREIDHRHSQPELAELQPLETVQGEPVQYQWSSDIHHAEQKIQSTEYQQVEPIRIESQWTELQQAQTQWVQLQKVEVEPQWSDYALIEPPQATPVLLNPVETPQAQYAEIQEVTEVRVVKKIRIYQEIIEEVERN